MGDSAIQWTSKTWNPVTGCTKVSPGCRSCYAEGIAERFWPTQYPMVEEDVRGPVGDRPLVRPRRFTDVQCHPERLEQPLRWRKPARVFVNSTAPPRPSDQESEHARLGVLLEKVADHAFFEELTITGAAGMGYTASVLLGDGDTEHDYNGEGSTLPGALRALLAKVEERP